MRWVAISQLPCRLANDRSRRIFLVAALSSEGLFTEPIAGVQLRPREPPFMPLKRPCRRDRGTAQSGGAIRQMRRLISEQALARCWCG